MGRRSVRPRSKAAVRAWCDADPASAAPVRRRCCHNGPKAAALRAYRRSRRPIVAIRLRTRAQPTARRRALPLQAKLSVMRVRAPRAHLPTAAPAPLAASLSTGWHARRQATGQPMVGTMASTRHPRPRPRAGREADEPVLGRHRAGRSSRRPQASGSRKVPRRARSRFHPIPLLAPR